MLNLRNIEFAYGGVKALDDVNMTMAPGKMTCVMGRNGVGKTTLMQNIIGLLRGSGSITLGDEEISGMTAHRRAQMGVALVPQGRMIFPKLTVEENLRIGLQARRDGGKSIPHEVFEVFPILKDFLKRNGGDLSGGQQQQLAIARAMVGEPRVMLLDEPTEGIQPNVIQQIGHVLKKLIAEKGMTIVLVEQYLDFVKEFGDHVYIMNRGTVVAETSASDMTPELVNDHLSV
ncbi:urea ABC transporter ATP-binding subunit UrtE [Algisphaera agarilytica]|uniref:Urea transport system ATP-binding protein n=1 Tax=Algisphaera agarilytica TaxID=1385975 RepID=A0A7X0LJS0_9BACT|nr:urea ABC transporter ATP-binding subunit UrtE [Algisphaera agarilytica]MBB6428238.1 urea transport system ATP-binding protein [Algisphaera agarilytica]